MTCALLLTGAVALHASPAAAQTSRKLSFQASALFADIYGDNFFAVAGGMGVEAQLRYTPGPLSIGGGVQFTRHNDSQAESEGNEGSIDLIGIFLEPRYVIFVGRDSYAPYVSARLAFARLDLVNDFADGTHLTWVSDGVTVNAGGGLLVRLSSRTNLDLGATAGFTSYAEGEGDYEGEPFTAPLGSGTNLVLRVGIAIGLGR